MLKIFSASKQIGQETHILVAGHELKSVVEDLKTNYSSECFSKIIVADHPNLKHNFGDAMENVLKTIIEKNKYTHVLSSSTSDGKEIIPRVAVGLDCQPLTDVTQILDKNHFVRPIYAGNAMITVKSNDPVKFLNIRTTSFDAISFNVQAISDVENLDMNEIVEKSDNKSVFMQHLKDELNLSDKPELTSAKIVVSGGRALKSKENFDIIEKLAESFGNAAVGASRAAVDAGYCPNDYQVGQTGKVVAPELYVAVGISGAIQHMAGMKDSKVIVAINKDSEAAIIQTATYSIIGDLFKIVPELTEKLQKLK